MWVSEEVNEWMNKWMNEWMSEWVREWVSLLFETNKLMIVLHFLFISRRTIQKLFFYLMRKPNLLLLQLKQLVLLSIFVFSYWFTTKQPTMIVILRFCLKYCCNSVVKSIRNVSKKTKFYRRAVSKFLYIMPN